MKNKLKEIRDKNYSSDECFSQAQTESIQSQTVELVLNEIEEYVNQELSEYEYSESDSFHAQAHAIYGTFKNKLNAIRTELQ